MDLRDDEIYQLSKYRFRKIVKNSLKEKAFEDLTKKKESHTKMNGVEYEKIEVQKYIKSNSSLKNEEKYILFKFRTRMAEVKNNFKNKYTNKLCPLCKLEEEDQYHLFNCRMLLDNCQELAENISVEYEDIFSTSLKKQEAAAKLLSKMWGTREKLIENIS